MKIRRSIYYKNRFEGNYILIKKSEGEYIWCFINNDPENNIQLYLTPERNLRHPLSSVYFLSAELIFKEEDLNETYQETNQRKEDQSTGLVE